MKSISCVRVCSLVSHWMCFWDCQSYGLHGLLWKVHEAFAKGSSIYCMWNKLNIYGPENLPQSALVWLWAISWWNFYQLLILAEFNFSIWSLKVLTLCYVDAQYWPSWYCLYDTILMHPFHFVPQWNMRGSNSWFWPWRIRWRCTPGHRSPTTSSWPSRWILAKTSICQKIPLFC